MASGTNWRLQCSVLCSARSVPELNALADKQVQIYGARAPVKSPVLQVAAVAVICFNHISSILVSHCVK